MDFRGREVLIGLFGLLAFASGAGAAPRPKLPDNYLPLPIMAQATDYSCGAAALQSVLVYWKAWSGHETDLYGLLETTPENGTEADKLAIAAEIFGLKASLKSEMSLDDLRAALARGDTVILDLQAWHDPLREVIEKGWKEIWDDGHYVVLIAMDERFAYFMDPSTETGYVYVPLDELMDRWHDYEDRHGFVQRYYRLGLTIRGKKGRPAYPGRLVRMH